MPTAATAFHILLAEDNADDVLLMQQAFRKAAVPSLLHPVHDGAEALAYLRGEGAYADRSRHPAPDILLLDLNMPRMNGFEALELLRQDPAWHLLPVYVLSASNLPADLRRAHELGANGYIVKPNRVDELVAFASALQHWLRFTVHNGVPGAPAR